MALTFETPITAFFGCCKNATIAATTTVFTPLTGGALNSNEAATYAVMALGGTFKNLYIATSSSQPGTGTLVATWRKNQAIQVALTVAAGSAAGVYSDTTSTFSCSANDSISISVRNNASGTSAAVIGTGCTMYGTETNYTHMRCGLSGNGGGTSVGAGTTNYMDFSNSGTSATEASVQTLATYPTYANHLSIRTNTTQSGTGSFVHTLRVNEVSTSIVATIAAGSAAGNYTSNASPVLLAAGDRIGVEMVNNASAGSATIVAKSIHFFDPHKRPRMNAFTTCAGDQVTLSATEYTPATSTANFNGTEANRLSAAPFDCVIKYFYVTTTLTQPSTGSLVLTMRKELADQAVTLTIAANAAAGNFSDLTNSFSASSGDRLSIKAVNGATSASCIPRIGFFMGS